MVKAGANGRAHGLAGSLSRGGVYQVIMLAAVAAVLTTVLAEPALGGALTNRPPNEQIRLEYLPDQQSVLVTTNDGKWFGSVGSLTLYDQDDTSTRIYVDLTQFYQHRAGGKLSWDDHVKLAGIANVGGHLPVGWASYNDTSTVDAGENWVSVLTPRVTGMTYQDKSGGGSKAIVTVSENIRDVNKDKICIINKNTQDEIECAGSVSAVNKTATATFLNNRPAATAQVVISSGFVQSMEHTYGHQWSMYAYTYDITYSGDPPPEATAVTYNGPAGLATITMNEVVIGANATNMCIVDKATQNEIVCAYAASASSTTALADFRNSGAPNSAAQLVIGAGAIQDYSETWNTKTFSYDVTYTGTPPPQTPSGPPTDNLDIDVVYYPDSGELEISSKAQYPFANATASKMKLYDVAQSSIATVLSGPGITVSDYTIDSTLSPSDRDKFAASDELRLELSSGWAYINRTLISDGVPDITIIEVVASEESVKIYAKPPEVSDASFNATTGVVTLNVTKPVQSVRADGICLVTNEGQTVCATTGGTSISGSTVTATMDVSEIYDPDKPDSIPELTLEVEAEAVQGYTGGWNDDAFKKGL